MGTGPISDIRAKIAQKTESFLLLAGKADETMTRQMRVDLGEILRQAKEDNKSTIGGGLLGPVIAAALGAPDSVLKIVAKRKIFEERFAKSARKISSLSALQLFYVIRGLNQFGLDQALNRLDSF